MAIDLDLSRALRGVDGLRSLVHAVVAGDSSDESEWLEWKTDLDLKTRPGCLHVAKAILGMANRAVEVAARTCEGFGYLIVGAEPGNLVGVVVPDPSDWVTRVEQYLKGGKGPAWSPMTVPVDGHDVLVVTIDPPKDGDPLWPLRRELDPYRSGTLFVRKPGRTEPATATDIDDLQRRLLAAGTPLPQVVLELHGDVPLPWIVGAVVGENVDAWVGAQRHRQEQAARAEEVRRTQRKTQDETTRLDSLGSVGVPVRSQSEQVGSLSAFGTIFQDEPETRTLSEYLKQLNAWVPKVREVLMGDLPRRYCDRGNGLVRLRVTNTSTQYLADVQVRLHIDFKEATGFEVIPDGTQVPSQPRTYGQPTPNSLARSLRSSVMPIPSFAPFSSPPMRDTTIEDGSIHVTLDAGELRPTRHFEGDEFFIFLPVRPPGGVLHATWEATVTNRDGVIEGCLTIPVQEEPVRVAELLSDEPIESDQG